MMKNTDVESQNAGINENRVKLEELNISEILMSYDPFHSSKFRIYRIPDSLRTLNEAAYTPQVVSIGPIHHKNPALRTMEMQKPGYLQAFLGRTQTTLTDFIIYTLQHEQKVRCCYEESIWGDDDFCSMVLLDGIFIIEYFMLTTGSLDDPTVLPGTTSYQPLNIESDLILLENQLPFFLLEGLYNLAFPPSKHDGMPSFLELVGMYFYRYNNNPIINPDLQVEHFTDLLRNFHLPPPKSPPKANLSRLPALKRRVDDRIKKDQWSKSATLLHEAGVKFRVARWKSLCDIQFNDGVLEMPCFIFHSSTESVISNLMAMEQCRYPYETYICHYFIFMDNLINTAKDVDLLVENGIIINWLGDSDAVANLVNRIPRNGLVVSFGFYANLCTSLNAHCDVGWHSWKVAFKRDYLSTPWKIASTTAAVILLLLTLIQAICSIVSLSV